jgi:hypothetical protein
MAKQILLEAAHVQLPEWSGTRSMPSPPTAIDANGITWAGRYVFRAARVAALASAEAERAIGGVRPDVLARDQEGVLLLEFRVTHRVDRAKREVVQARRYRMVEIDLSKLTFDDAADRARFTALVLHEAANRHWICLPDAEDDWRAALADLEAQLASPNHISPAAPPIDTRVPPFTGEPLLSVPSTASASGRAQHSQLRSAPLGSRLWHSGHGVGTLVRRTVPNAAVYVVDFPSYGELTIVLNAAGEGVSWQILGKHDP